MPCYMCRTTKGPFQRLEVARLRFIRKAQPHFRDDSYLCLKCFEQFEKIYQSKSKTKSRNSSRTSISSASTKSVSTTKDSSSREKDDGNKNNSESFDARSINSHTSFDSTDRIVQMAPAFMSLRDSSRKTVRNPLLNVARQGAEAAVRIELNSQTALAINPPLINPEDKERSANDTSSERETSEPLVHFDSVSTSSVDTTDRIVRMVPNFPALGGDSTFNTNLNPELTVARQEAEAAVQNTSKRQRTTPPNTPPAKRRVQLQVVDEESEDEDLASQLSPNNLAHVRPVVRRRKGAIVRQYDEVMDMYIARTSGG